MGGDPEGIDPVTAVVEMLRPRIGRHRASVGDRPYVIGVAGAVAVGKSTLAAGLAGRLGGPVAVLGTDSFLFPNEVLAERDLALRKGFPESYDERGLVAALEAVRGGREVRVPVYSHEMYDVTAGAERVITPGTALVLEGVNALRFRPLLDYGIYVHAPVEVIEAWYLARVVTLVASASPGSFYGGWAGLTEDEVVTSAKVGWDSVNLVNLVEHIAPTSNAADVVVQLGAEHQLLGLGPPVQPV